MPNRLLKNKKVYIGLFISAFFAVIVLPTLAAEWKGPTLAPPGANKEEPINVGTDVQAKYGTLMLLEPEGESGTSMLFIGEEDKSAEYYKKGTSFRYNESQSPDIIHWVLPSATSSQGKPLIIQEVNGNEIQLGWGTGLDIKTQDEDFGYVKISNVIKSIGTLFFTRFLKTGTVDGDMNLGSTKVPSFTSPGPGDVYIEERLEVDGRTYLDGGVDVTSGAKVAGGLNIGLTDGSIIFQKSGILDQDNANLFWKAADKRLGLGTNAPVDFILDANDDVGPHTTKTFNLGSDSKRWKKVYAETFDGAFNPGFTLGSVIFQGANGLAEKNAKFFWNNANENLGIGTNTQNANTKLQINAPTGKEGLRIISASDYSPLNIRNSGDTSDIFRVNQSGRLEAGIIPWARLADFPTPCTAPSVLAGYNTDGTAKCVEPLGISGGNNGETLYYKNGGWQRDTNIYNEGLGGNVGIGTTATGGNKLFVSGDTFVSGKLGVSGLISGTGGLNITNGIVNLNDSSNYPVNIGTGWNYSDVSIGGGNNNVIIDSNNTSISATDDVTIKALRYASINTSDWKVSTLGVMTGISGISTDGYYTQTGDGYNIFSGTSTFSNAGTSAWFASGVVIGSTVGTTTASSEKLQVKGDAVPYTDLTWNLGSPSRRWKNIYAQGINMDFKTGSVVFQGTSSLAEDNDHFFWDVASSSLSVGGKDTSAKFSVYSRPRRGFLYTPKGKTPYYATVTATGNSVKNGIRFEWEFLPGDIIIIGGQERVVTKVVDDSELTVSPNWSGTTTGTYEIKSKSFSVGKNNDGLALGGGNIAANPNTASLFTHKLFSLYVGTSLFAHNSGLFDTGDDWLFSNTFMGIDSGKNIVTGSYNTSFGYKSLSDITPYARDGNTAFGAYALSGSFNVIGQNWGDRNSAFGAWAMASNSTSTDNIAFGYYSLYSNLEGSKNVAIGSQTLQSNTLGNNSVAIGFNSLYNNIDGSYNVAIGSEALNANIYGGNNIAIGYQALYKTGLNTAKKDNQGLNNVAIGSHALGTNIFGSNSVAIGHNALYNNGRTVSDYWPDLFGNVAIGAEAGSDNQLGYNNVFVGLESGRYSTSSENVFLGAGTGRNNKGTRNVFIGFNAGKNYTDATTSSDLLIINNADTKSSTTEPLIFGKFASAGKGNSFIRFNGDSLQVSATTSPKGYYKGKTKKLCIGDSGGGGNAAVFFEDGVYICSVNLGGSDCGSTTLEDCCKSKTADCY